MYELKFADIGEGVHEGEILEWHVKVGDEVAVEQLLLEVNTEKVNAEITSPVAGKIVSIEYEDGAIVKVGDILLTIDQNNESNQEKTIVSKKVDSENEVEKDDSLFTPAFEFKRVKKQNGSKKQLNGKVLASPAVRHRAKKAGIDLSKIEGSARAGRVTKEDLATYIEQSTSRIRQTKQMREFSVKLEERIPLRGLRRSIANSMRKSKDMAAHYTFFEEVDMTALRDLREQLKPEMERRGIKIGYPALIMKFLIPVLRKYPIINSSLDEENQEIVIKNYYNLGISVDTEEGLVVPVIKNVENKSIWEIAEVINSLAQKARKGKLLLDDVSGGTFTVTSVGNIGGLMATPIIKYPEVAILGLMKAKLKPVVTEQNGRPEIVIRYMMNLSFSLDHRVVDGALAARFIGDLVRYIENPVLLYLEDTL